MTYVSAYYHAFSGAQQVRFTLNEFTFILVELSILNPFPHTTILQQMILNIFCQKIEISIIEWMPYN